MPSATSAAGLPGASPPVRAEHSVAVLVARAGLALAVALVAATLVLLALTRSNEAFTLTGSQLRDGVLIVAFLAYSVVGALVVSRRPGSQIGWIFLASGLCLHLWTFSARYATYGLVVRPGSLPGAEVAAWTSLWIGIPAFGLAFTILLLVLPDGRLPFRGSRPVAWFAGIAVSFATLAWATAPGPIDMFDQLANPVGVEFVGVADLPGLGWGLLLLAVLASAASLVVRYVRSTGVERRQLQWFAYAAALVGLTWLMITIASAWEPAEVVADLMFPVAIAGLPIAAFVAIFKHDLYDLEIVISRTITFGALAAFITASYVVVVAGVGSAVGVAGESNLALAVLATALVAVAFQPARARVQRLASRLVYGRRATPYEVLAELAHRIGEALSAEAALPHMARVLSEATSGSKTGVWLLMGDELQRVACWPPEPGRPTVPLPGRGPPHFPSASRAVEVRHQDRLLGAITLAAGRTLNTTEQRLLTDLAAHAGLILDNLRLIEELKASRQRIVTAQDQERRRLERDIHDGVQQRLLALALALRTETATAPSDSNGDPGAVLTAADEARGILAELRRLARGIHPAIVTEGGLAAALESLAERSPIPTEVRTSDIEPLPEATEITVYYVVAEALANVTKHAEASAATVTVQAVSGRVRVEVMDDGIGGAIASGSGLTGLADRVAALGGLLTVDSPPGSGTRVCADIPCGLS